METSTTHSTTSTNKSKSSLSLSATATATATSTTTKSRTKDKETSSTPSHTTSTTATTQHHQPLHPCCTTTTTILLLLVATAALLVTTAILTVAVTALKQRKPTITLDSVTLTSISPSITLTPRGSLLLNATLHLDLLLLNPNRAAFHHSTGSTLLFYRGSHVGSAEVSPGTIPGKGLEHVACAVMAEAEKLEQEMGRVVKDVQRGELEFEAKSRIEGRLVILGFIRKKVSAETDCFVVVGLGPLRVLRHNCSTGS